MMTPLSGLITGGLGLPAGQYMLTMQFHLFPNVSVVVSTMSGGGSQPFAPGEIQNWYKPVENIPGYIKIPDWKEADLLRKKKHVTLTLKFNDKEISKEYVIAEKSLVTIVKVNNFIESSKNKIKVLVNKVEKVGNGIKFIFKNFRQSKNK